MTAPPFVVAAFGVSGTVFLNGCGCHYGKKGCFLAGIVPLGLFVGMDLRNTVPQIRDFP